MRPEELVGSLEAIIELVETCTEEFSAADLITIQAMARSTCSELTFKRLMSTAIKEVTW